MADTIQISCPNDAYTALSNGQANVTFKFAGPNYGNFIVATSQPSVNATTFMRVTPSDFPVALGNLGASDKVYFKPDSNGTAQVLRG